jgi:hypothetical protein
MRYLLLLAAVLPLAALAEPDQTQYLLTTSECSQITLGRYSRAMEVQNNAPNPVWCAFKEVDCKVGSPSRRLAAGESWSFEGTALWCIATTADHADAAGLTVSEL